MSVTDGALGSVDVSDMIYKRKSVRSYIDVPVDILTLSKISEFADNIRPLYPNIKTKIELVSRDEFISAFSWIPDHAAVILSESAEGMYENAGFVLQQLELYIQSLGLGVCWLGMGRMKKHTLQRLSDNGKLEFISMIVFGYPKGAQQRTDPKEFSRKPLAEISDTCDIRLEPARLAPSGINSQPWFFVGSGDVFHVYCRKTILSAMSGKMDMTSVGISLSHMYVANQETFKFFRQENPENRHGFGYCGSFEI